MSDFPMPTWLSAKINWLIAGTIVILLVPILKVLVEYQTFIHPWRPELVASVVLLISLAFAFHSLKFREFLADLPQTEFRWLVLPCLLFIVWSLASVSWARSPVFALYHTSLWISYLAFYCLFRYFTRDDASTERWMIGLMAFMWMICLPPLIEYYAYVVSGNSTTIGLRYSKYTEIANTIAPLIAAFAIKTKGRSMSFAYVTIALVWLFDIASLSRTGAGMFVIAMMALLALVYALPSLRQYRFRSTVLASLLIVVTIVSSAALIAAAGSIPTVDRALDPASADSASIRPLFLNIAVEMWRGSPFVGVGADNYGLEFSDAREKYAERRPDDKALAFADDQLAERAHNEYGQILAELGGVGILIFGTFLAGIAVCAFQLWRQRRKVSLNTAAALVGVGAFLASSLVTSYSFRIFQNGLVFFFVLAVAAGGTLASEERHELPKTRRISRPVVLAGLAVVLLSSVFLAAYSLIRVAAVHEMLNALAATETAEKDRHFANALSLDPENAVIYRAAGLTKLSNDDPAGAAAFLKEAVARGQSTTTDYSYLATAQILSGDTAAAVETIAKALRQYPRSAFLHVRLGVLLNLLDKPDEATQQLTLANQLNASQTATWMMFLEYGAVKATKFAFDSKGVALMDLEPRNAVYAVQKERELRFPDEKFTIPQ